MFVFYKTTLASKKNYHVHPNIMKCTGRENLYIYIIFFIIDWYFINPEGNSRIVLWTVIYLPFDVLSKILTSVTLAFGKYYLPKYQLANPSSLHL